MELYIHIPFCIRKCRYCDFLSFPCRDAGAETMEAYAGALRRELDVRRAMYADRHFDTAFIGGGTPSVLTPAQLEQVLLGTAQYGPFDEFTVECNPGTLDRDKLRVMKELGVNRISLGLQSANDGELETLGRIHTYSDFLRSYELVRETGFDNVSIDLMSAIPGQTRRSLSDTLKEVARLRPEHLSVYSLIIEEGTPFYAMYGPGTEGEKLLTGEDEDREMYRMTRDMLQAAGYARYEISNYSLSGRECRHNLGYWTGEEYTGCGIGAASYVITGRDTAERLRQTSELSDYISDPVAGVTVEEKLVKADLMSEYMILHLRLSSGILKDDFAKRFGLPVEKVFGKQLVKYTDARLLEDTGGSVRLTDRGFDLAGMVMADMLPD